MGSKPKSTTCQRFIDHPSRIGVENLMTGYRQLILEPLRRWLTNIVVIVGPGHVVWGLGLLLAAPWSDICYLLWH